MPSASEEPKLRLIHGGGCAGQEAPALYTVAEVAVACGLPQPVVAQLVPRAWTRDGWMFTPAQLASAVEIAEELRSNRGLEAP